MRKQTVKITCDRCGKEMPHLYDTSFRLYKKKIITDYEDDLKEIDLCKECCESLKKWYRQKENSEV